MVGGGAAARWNGTFCGEGGGLELQRNDVAWVPFVDVAAEEVLEKQIKGEGQVTGVMERCGEDDISQILGP